MQFDHGPLRSTENDKGYSTAFKVLLITHVLIGSYQHVKTGLFCRRQESAVAERIPSPLLGLPDYVARKNSRYAFWRHMVKENEHPRYRGGEERKRARRDFGRRIQGRRLSVRASRQLAR